MRGNIENFSPEMGDMSGGESEVTLEDLESNSEASAADIREGMRTINKDSRIDQAFENTMKDLAEDLGKEGFSDEEIRESLERFEARVEGKVRAAKSEEADAVSDGEKVADAVFGMFSTVKEAMSKEGFWQKFSSHMKLKGDINNFDDVSKIYSRVDDKGLRRVAYLAGHLREVGDALIVNSYVTVAAGLAITAGIAGLQKEYVDAAQVALGMGALAAAQSTAGAAMRILGAGKLKSMLRKVRDYPRQYKAPDFGVFKFKFLLDNVHLRLYGTSKTRYNPSNPS